MYVCSLSLSLSASVCVCVCARALFLSLSLCMCVCPLCVLSLCLSVCLCLCLSLSVRVHVGACACMRTCVLLPSLSQNSLERIALIRPMQLIRMERKENVYLRLVECFSLFSDETSKRFLFIYTGNEFRISTNFGSQRISDLENVICVAY